MVKFKERSQCQSTGLKNGEYELFFDRYLKKWRVVNSNGKTELLEDNYWVAEDWMDQRRQ
jgi:hypothetical protein